MVVQGVAPLLFPGVKGVLFTSFVLGDVVPLLEVGMEDARVCIDVYLNTKCM